MATFYIDLENGNDANAGTSYALRWKTFTSGATAARIGPGDTIRVMASPNETLVGTAWWTNGSATVTLGSAVTVSISRCNVAWTASANVTCSADTGAYKEGAASSRLAIAAGFTTGLAAYEVMPSSVVDTAGLGAHRYWRLLITANNGDATYCNVGELELIDGTGTDQTGSGTPTADSAQSAGAWPVTNLFDNNLSNFFAFGTGPTYPHWVAYDFGAGNAKEIMRFKMTSGIAGGGSAAQQPKDFELQYSDDGSTWTTGWAVTGATGWTAETRTYTHATASDVSTPLDLSGYQQVSFWIRNDVAIADGATLSLRLCSDSAGATTVNTIAIPAIPGVNEWVPVTVDTGAALGSSISSVALYCDKDPGAITLYIDNISACKASSSADSLSLTSLIGKVWNRCWEPSTAYAANEIRKPTQPNRNGFRYKVTAGGGGSSGSSEPAWPLEVGRTVADGALTWTCEGLEETWHTVKSIVGTAVTIDAAYIGSTESVATYKREAIKHALLTYSWDTTAHNQVMDSGSASAPITISGGWDRTSMATQDGETWISGQNRFGQAIYVSNKSYLEISNINAVRCYTGIRGTSTGQPITLRNLHASGCVSGIEWDGILSVYGLSAINSINTGINLSGMVNGRCLSAHNTRGNTPEAGVVLPYCNTQVNYVSACGNGQYGVRVSANAASGVQISNVTTANNGVSGVFACAGLVFNNLSSSESTPFTGIQAVNGAYVYSHKHGGVADSHYIYTDGASIVSATDQRHTPSGISWKFRITSTVRTSYYPVVLPVAKIACSAGVSKSVTIWTRRDNTNIKGKLKVQSGQLAGVGEASVACEPSINTWVQSSALTFTPTEAGVVEITFEVWDGVGTTNNYWIDDLAIS
ncbi:MAG: discoidin domain-containing protein [Telluria sp.]